MAKSIDFIEPLEGYTQVYQKKVKKFSCYADLKNVLGLLYYLQGKNARALHQFEQALSINPRYEEAMINKCFVLNVQGKEAKAVKELKAFIKKTRNRNQWGFLVLSILEFERGHSKQALLHAKESLKKNPEDPYSLVVAGMCLCSNNKKTQAKKMFRKAQDLSYVISSINKELEFYHSGDFCLKNIEKVYPYFIRNPFVNDLLVRIAEELAKADDLKMSKKLIDFALTRGAASSRLLNFLGIMALKEKRILDAVRLFHSAFTRDHTNAYPAIHLFFLYGEKGEWIKAKKILDDALRYNPEYADLHNYKGMYFADSNKKQLALKEFQKALKINPWYLDALYNMAHLCEEMRKYPQAAEAYLKICSIRKISSQMEEKLSQLASLMKKPSVLSLQRKIKKELMKKNCRNKTGFKRVLKKIS